MISAIRNITTGAASGTVSGFTNSVKEFYKRYFRAEPLNIAMKDSIYEYVGPWYKKINNYLRYGSDKLSALVDEYRYLDKRDLAVEIDKIKEKIKSLDEIFRLVYAQTPKEITVYRGISSNMYTRVKDQVKRGSFSDEAYMSAAYKRNHLTSRYPYLMEIKIPKGSKILDIDAALGKTKGEDEVLLPRKSRLKFLSESGNTLKMQLINN